MTQERTLMRTIRRFRAGRGASIAFAAAVPFLTVLSGCYEERGDPRTFSVLPVRSEVVTEQEFRSSLKILGVVRPAETVPLVAVNSGTISYPSRFPVGLRTGEKVRAGEMLARVSNEMVRLELIESRLQSESAATELERVSAGLEAGIIPLAEYSRQKLQARLARERLESAEREADRLSILAPRDGTLVVERSIPSGTEIAAGTKIGELAAHGPPTIEGWAAAADRERLEVGLPVRFRAPGGGEPTGKGRIREISPVVDESGTLRVVAEVTDAEGVPPPGEGVEMEVELARRLHVLTVPRDALIITADGSALFLLEPRGRTFQARRVAVETGEIAGDRVEILSGLEAGDRVAVAGVSLLSDGVWAQDPALSSDATPGESPAPAVEDAGTDDGTSERTEEAAP
jgi:RND family efflux transporter MFP subunit